MSVVGIKYSLELSRNKLISENPKKLIQVVHIKCKLSFIFKKESTFLSIFCSNNIEPHNILVFRT